MLIKNKKTLRDLVEKNIVKFPLVRKYFSRTIKKIFTEKSLNQLLEIPLIRYLATEEATIKNFEKFIEDRSFTNIESPLSRLKSNLGEYHAVLAELQTATKLKEDGIGNIKFLAQSNKNPDLEFEEEGEKRYAEVKGLMSISPDFSILNDKLEARSLQETLFKRDFTVSCEYNIFEFSGVDKLHKKLTQAVDELIALLGDELKNGDVQGLVKEIGGFKFKVTSRPSSRKEFLLLFVGGMIAYSNRGDIFLKLSSVYERFISSSRTGYLQLLHNRGNDKHLVKKDRLYLFLGIERGSHISNEVKRTFQDLAGVLGIDDMVDLRINF